MTSKYEDLEKEPIKANEKVFVGVELNENVLDSRDKLMPGWEV